jgi:glutamyl-tRNA synthetase
LFDRARDFWGKEGNRANNSRQKEVLAIVQERLKTLADLPTLSEYFFTRPTPDWSMIENNKQLSKIPRNELLKLLATARATLAEIEPTDWNEENLQEALNGLLEQTGQKPPILFGVIRFALTWAPFSPGLPETMTLLGNDETLERLDSAI